MPKNKYAEQEEEILKFWKKNKVFERSITERPKDKPYVFYDGPPFATGLPHYGHILSSVIKDIFPRYWTMKGKRVRRRWGWDCHGLPIETIVEKELGISGKKQIEEKGIDKFNQKARNMVLAYADKWKETVDRIGRWVEFDDSYKTMDSTYMESVWWALKSIWDKGLIYEGRKVLLYCPRCETPVSNAEVQMDNSYKDIEEESVTVKFHLLPNQKFGRYETQQSAYMLSWTTTPWTLPGNVALAVGKNINYTALRIKGESELLILASELVEQNFKKDEIEIVHDDIKGSDFTGLKYEPLYEIEAVKNSQNKAWYVTPADFVTTQEGTGVVHTAVIYGEDDFALGLEIDLPQVPLLDSTGHYNAEAPKALRGKYIKDAEGQIVNELEKKGLLFARKPHTHSYPFCWRCENPLIYNAISAWFINIQKIKDRLIELNKKINWYPEYLKNGRFLNILRSAPDWNISRNRYWATPLPFFKCEKCDKTECIGSLKELEERSDNYAEVYSSKGINEIDLHRPYIDKIILKCPECSSKMTRTAEVIDCWVESASMPFAEWHYPFENKDEFENRFPGQFVGEYIAQTRAWFYYMHVISTLLFDEISFENVVATGTILSEKGEKLSKSKKNFPNPIKVIDAYGSDSLRFYLMSSVVMQADNLSFNEKDLREAYNKVINTINNVLSFYRIYKDEIGAINEVEGAHLGAMDRYIISRLESSIELVTEAFDNYDTVKASRQIRLFIEDLSLWWLRRSRERFRSADKLEREVAMTTVKYVLRKTALMIAPLLPFTSEIVWQDVKTDKDEESVHLANWPSVQKEMIDQTIEDGMGRARKIVEAGHSLRQKNSIRVRQPLSKIFFNLNFGDLDDEIIPIILDELNIEKNSPENSIEEPDSIEDKGLKVVIDKKIDKRLRDLGDLREITRAIQNLRKKSNLSPGDMANVGYLGERQAIEFIKKRSDEIKSATNLKKLQEVKTRSDDKVAISQGTIYLNILK